MKKKNIFKIQTISVYIITMLVLLLLGVMGILFIGAKAISKSVRGVNQQKCDIQSTSSTRWTRGAQRRA